MATDKPKLQGYVERHLFERFTQWKGERGIQKDSAALNMLLIEFFGVPSPQVPSPDETRIRQIVEELIEEKLKALPGNLASDLPSDTDLLTEIANDFGELSDKFQELESRLSNLEKAVPVTGRSPDNRHNGLPSESLSNLPTLDEDEADLLAGELTPTFVVVPNQTTIEMKGVDLAKRLGINPATLVKNRTKPRFTQWARGKDPKGLGWEYLPDKQRYESVN